MDWIGCLGKGCLVDEVDEGGEFMGWNGMDWNGGW